MKQFLLLLLTFTVTSLPCWGQNLNGKVKGVVVDWLDARVLGTTVIFQNKKFRQSIEVNPDGEYEIELPIGNFTVRVYQQGFQPYKYNSLKIMVNETKTLVIKLKYTQTYSYKCPAGVPCL